LEGVDSSVFKPTKSKIVLFLTIVIVGLSPLLFFGSGPALILPIVEIFWLPGLASAFGAPVAVDGGVDAFNLIPPTVLGIGLTLVGFGISLAVQYIVACALVTGVSKPWSW
jgi:hypothetical protein